jgi:hypothetical protein
VVLLGRYAESAGIAMRAPSTAAELVAVTGKLSVVVFGLMLGLQFLMEHPALVLVAIGIALVVFVAACWCAGSAAQGDR